MWKETRVIFINKPGKDNYNNPKAYRPISLSNYLMKGLEKLVGWRTDKKLRDCPLNSMQHGFVKGKSTDSAISEATTYIEKSIFNGKKCVGVFWTLVRHLILSLRNMSGGN